MDELNSKATRRLQTISGLHLMAVKQHFIHVLILEARGDKANAARITAIDSVDLPLAMQTIDWLLAHALLPQSHETDEAFADSMPHPGYLEAEIWRSEQALETRLTSALEDGRDSLIPKDTYFVHDLIAQARAPRSKYGRWLKRNLESGSTRGEPSLPPERDEILWIDCLFANLMVLIEQGLIHAFVHRHSGDKTLANTAWEISGAAMMQATQITKLLAEHGLAPAPRNAVLSSLPVNRPLIGLRSDQALANDKALAKHIAWVAERCGPIPGMTDLGTSVQQMQSFFEAAANWNEGEPLRYIVNPCRDFERTLTLYMKPPGSEKIA